MKYSIYESIWVKLNLEHNKTKIVGSVYRPNSAKGDLKRAITIHETILQELKSNNAYKHSDLLVCSDFNVDILNYDRHQLTADYVDFQVGLGLLPLITKPTRKYQTSATLIFWDLQRAPLLSMAVRIRWRDNLL